MANSKTVVIVAVNGKETSKPVRLYLRNGYEEPTGQFVLAVNDEVNRDGDERIRIGNSNVGLIASHGPDYINEVLTGFRRKDEEGNTFFVAKMFKEDIPSMSKIAKMEIF